VGLGLEFKYGQTAIDEEEKEGLKILSVQTNAELDEFEQKNIEEAIFWTIGKRITVEKLLSEQFVKSLHKRMFGDVWSWAGKFRMTEKNIGIQSWKIPSELRILIDDALFWIENESYSEEEIAIRFKHRLVSIHCFPNGNGRHSRLMADLIIEKVFQQPVFTWGRLKSRQETSFDPRKEYLAALKKADMGDYSRLIVFARL
jgi:Fic-DOC domain mobile mystery protein B